jgi:hypothetical protein
MSKSTGTKEGRKERGRNEKKNGKLGRKGFGRMKKASEKSESGKQTGCRGTEREDVGEVGGRPAEREN